MNYNKKIYLQVNPSWIPPNGILPQQHLQLLLYPRIHNTDLFKKMILKMHIILS